VAELSDGPAAVPGAREGHPVGIPPRWGLSSLDWHAHVIDEDTDHPYGVYVARCRQRLFMGTSLRA
jgi:hypothetical protein